MEAEDGRMRMRKVLKTAETLESQEMTAGKTEISKCRIVCDFLWSLMGVALMHAVLQFWFYPQMNRIYGPEWMGKILFLISWISIFVMAFGIALDNTRLVTRFRFQTGNGDFNLLLLLFSAIAVLCCLPVGLYVFPESDPVVFVLWVILTLVRFYSAVEFRLTINTPGYFVYHALLALGYAVGAWLMFCGLDWMWAFCLGEAFALGYVTVVGKIYRPPFWRPQNLKKMFQTASTLAGAGLLNQGGQNLDRILLPVLVGALANAQFYVVSLLGKILSMFAAPLNSVLISYLCQSEKKMTRTNFILLGSAVVLMGSVFFVGCWVCTPCFLRVFYADLYESAQPLIFIATLGQVVGFSSMVLLTAVLTVADEKWQLRIQGVYALLFLLLVWPLTEKWGLWGFGMAILLANSVRFLITFGLGIAKTGGSFSR